MKRTSDTIQFEHKEELEELLKIIDKYVKQNPTEKQNKILKDFFYLIDDIDMFW